MMAEINSRQTLIKFLLNNEASLPVTISVNSGVCTRKWALTYWHWRQVFTIISKTLYKSMVIKNPKNKFKFVCLTPLEHIVKNLEELQ